MTIKVTFTNSDSDVLGSIDLFCSMAIAIELHEIQSICETFREKYNNLACSPLNYTITYHNEDM